MELAQLVINVQDDVAILTYGNITDAAHIKATAYYALTFAPVAIVMGFTEAGCDYVVAQRPPVRMATSEAEDGTLSLQIQQTSTVDLQAALLALEGGEADQWAIEDDMLWGIDSKVSLARLLGIVDGAAVTP